jgi:hypothetical protein
LKPHNRRLLQAWLLNSVSCRFLCFGLTLTPFSKSSCLIIRYGTEIGVSTSSMALIPSDWIYPRWLAGRTRLVRASYLACGAIDNIFLYYTCKFISTDFQIKIKMRVSNYKQQHLSPSIW